MNTRYGEGDAVRSHTDEDYHSSFQWIVSMNLTGKADFEIQHQLHEATIHRLPAADGNAFVFDRSLRHGATAASLHNNRFEPRIVVTARWAPRNTPGPQWYPQKWQRRFYMR